MPPEATETATEQAYIRLAVQQSGKVRTETLMGREFRVVPAVLVQSQVLNNNLGRTFLPEDEITQSWADTANHAPVLSDHPSRRGQPASGRDPDILNQLGVGFLFGARAEPGKIRADVWLDPSRATDVPDLGVVLGKLDRGETPELSTGFPLRLVEETPGAFNGLDYDRVIRPAGFDHLAVFAEKTGACSVTDGCGLGINHAADCELVPVENSAPATINVDGEEVPVASDLPRAGIVARAKAWLSGLFGVQESDQDRHELLRSALREQFGGEDVFLWPTAVYSDDGYLVYERESNDDAGLFRVDFEINDDGAVTFSEPMEVRRVTTFEPVANAGDLPPEEGSTMNREQMIAHLAENGRDKDVLSKLSDCDLKALMGAGKPATNAEPSDPDERSWQQKALAYRGELDALKEKSEHALNQEREERVSLLDDLLYKGRSVEWTENELKEMALPQLRKVHRQVFNVADYSGQGGPRSVSPTNTFNWFKPRADRLREPAEGVN